MARTGGNGCAYWELVGKSDRKRPLGGPIRRQEINKKKHILNKYGGKMWTGLMWLRIGPHICCYEHGNELLNFIVCPEFLN